MSTTARSSRRWTEEQRRRERELLEQFATLDVDDPVRSQVRDELITMHLPLVQHLAWRYRDRGEPLDDIVQAGTIGLIKAIDGFEIDRGVELSTYATPTILGEIKRHFRDRTWAVHVPRRLQELQGTVATRIDELSTVLHRSPTVREVAQSLDISEQDVLDALDVRRARTSESLDHGAGSAEADAEPASVAVIDPAFDDIDDRESLRPLLQALPAREQAIITMRFARGMSQSAIAEELGMSQMHVSRLLARSLRDLREGLTREAD